MIKKIAALAGAGAILLSLAVPVFAFHRHHQGGDVAIIEGNNVIADANTGYNDQGALATDGGDVDAYGTRYISTGDAHAKAMGVIIANTDVKCGCRRGGDKCGCEKDMAVVKNNTVRATANSGYNYQDAIADGASGSQVDAGGNRTIYTGSAWAKAKGFAIVNTDLSFGRR